MLVLDVVRGETGLYRPVGVADVGLPPHPVDVRTVGVRGWLERGRDEGRYGGCYPQRSLWVVGEIVVMLVVLVVVQRGGSSDVAELETNVP